MSDIFHMLFNVGPSIMKIFEYGMKPKKSDIHELTPEQYAQLAQKHSYDMSGKWFTWMPVKHSYESNELLILTEDQKNHFLEAAAIIEKYAVDSGKKFRNYNEKLTHVAKMLPPVFSDGTKYETKHESKK